MSAGRFLVAAFGDAGHAFPAIGLARALAAARPRGGGRDLGALARGGRGRGARVHGGGGVQDLPPPGARRADGPSAADAALALVPLMEEQRFDVVVSDILTLAPALAAERAGLRRATLIPHVYPVHEPGMPFFAFGALPPRTAVGAGGVAGALPVLIGGLRRGREEMNESRAAVGLRADRSGFTAGSASGWRWSRRSRSSSTAALAGRTCR